MPQFILQINAELNKKDGSSVETGAVCVVKSIEYTDNPDAGATKKYLAECDVNIYESLVLYNAGKEPFRAVDIRRTSLKLLAASNCSNADVKTIFITKLETKFGVGNIVEV